MTSRCVDLTLSSHELSVYPKAFNLPSIHSSGTRPRLDHSDTVQDLINCFIFAPQDNHIHAVPSGALRFHARARLLSSIDANAG